MFHKFRLNGDCLFSFPTKPRKTPEKPWDIAVSPNDNTIYISDWSRRRVYVYNGQNGKKIRSIKGCYRRGKKDEFVEFSRPAGITFDLGGRLMIADRGERCVWCINTEGDELIKTIGDGHIQDPYGIAVAKDGKIVVSESESDCVSVFGDDGELLHYFGGTGTGEGQLCRPHHVFIDSNMKIYVADTQNKRVQIFSLPEGLYQNLMPAPTADITLEHP
ncbi:Tripartite motif-containing protein 3 [Geodia barretti]|uniref:Tripartite motif-containing protein 3 n=1 Tax=Geodia barretti TaxID=519541 RepID=A0AA35SFS6_GEOBA|nr:Tripartite motif-containing protein 3 [Geodia barretti]